MTEDIKIKPCPFCGCEANLKTGEHKSYGDPVRFVAFVECSNCFASSGRVLIDMEEKDWAVKARINARRLWNRRSEEEAEP